MNKAAIIKSIIAKIDPTVDVNEEEIINIDITDLSNISQNKLNQVEYGMNKIIKTDQFMSVPDEYKFTILCFVGVIILLVIVILSEKMSKESWDTLIAMAGIFLPGAVISNMLCNMTEGIKNKPKITAGPAKQVPVQKPEPELDYSDSETSDYSDSDSDFSHMSTKEIRKTISALEKLKKRRKLRRRS